MGVARGVAYTWLNLPLVDGAGITMVISSKRTFPISSGDPAGRLQLSRLRVSGCLRRNCWSYEGEERREEERKRGRLGRGRGVEGREGGKIRKGREGERRGSGEEGEEEEGKRSEEKGERKEGRV